MPVFRGAGAPAILRLWKAIDSGSTSAPSSTLRLCGQRQAVPRGHDDVFAHAPGQLPGRPEENELPAGVRTADEALVAPAADDGRLDHHPVAGLQTARRGADAFDDAGAFVADDRRIDDDLVPDPAVEVIVDVRAADADRPHLHEDIVVADRPRHRNVADLDFFQPGKYDRFHGRFSCALNVYSFHNNDKNTQRFPAN